MMWTCLLGRNKAQVDNRQVCSSGKGVGGTNWGNSTGPINTTYVCKKNSLMGNLLHSTGTQLDALWQPRGVGWEGGGGSRGKDDMYPYSWFSLLYSRNEYIIVKQLYSSKKEWQTERKVSISCGFQQNSPCNTILLDPDISFVGAAVTQSRLKWSASAGCWRRQYSLRITVEGGTGTQACWVVLGFHIPGNSNHFTPLN